jgi:3-deoxy-manno-octulosonate cytidylyltransferase (CMP-KDO synthetase)
MSEVFIVVPAREASSRLSRKIMEPIGPDGIPLAVFTASRMQDVAGVDMVAVATDCNDLLRYLAATNSEIRGIATGEVVSGTQRVALAINNMPMPPRSVVSLQADEPEIPLGVVTKLAKAVRSANPIRDPPIWTIACRLSEGDLENRNCVKVTVNRLKQAVYFSRAPLAGAYRHVGVYGFSNLHILKWAASIKPTPLQRAENLEQLAWIEHAIPIRVLVFDQEFPRGIDTATDLAEFRDRLAVQIAKVTDAL